MKTKRNQKRPVGKWLAFLGLLSALIAGIWLWILAKAKPTVKTTAQTKAPPTTTATVPSSTNTGTYVPHNQEFSGYEFDSSFA